MRYLPGDKGCDAESLGRLPRESGTPPVIPGRRNRKRAIRDDQQRYRGRHLIGNAFRIGRDWSGERSSIM